MAIEINLHHPPAENNYFEKGACLISKLPQNSMVFIDIDNTAVKSVEGSNLVRSDFDRLYTYIGTEREDLDIFTISYRSKISGIPELSHYSFTGSIFMEDMQQTLLALSSNELAHSIFNFLAIKDDFVEDYKIVDNLLQTNLIKLRFLIAMFAEELTHAFLIDDGEDGRLAQILGVGLWVK